jgi:ATP-dependent RNA helicase SUPV3L1/SUV3
LPSHAPSPPPSAAPPAGPDAFQLPDPRHAARLPPGLTVAQLNRIRQAAYALPQVVQPTDLPQASGVELRSSAVPDAEAALDAAGLVLLQRGVPGARPSRWISPALIDVALAHLAAVPAGREVRALMAKRAAVLESEGLLREGDGWVLQTTQMVPVPSLDTQLPVAYVLPAPSAPVWRFYRDGDMDELEAAVAYPAPYAHADELAAHLESLGQRAMARQPREADLLRPVLQAECTLPRDFAALKAACTRAFEVWESRVAELDTLHELNTRLAFQGYPDTFALARKLQRQVTLFVGPPNSGKTYAAFERLAQAAHGTAGDAVVGAYLAPLRLLALEGRDRLQARGVACSLRTGEENVPADGARVVSSTIEMVATGREIEVAVIDEAQMIFDASRGWAWTQAIVAVPAREVIVICSAYAVPALQTLLGLCGEDAVVRQFERKQHVQMLPGPVAIAGLKKGDAVVAFSRREVLMLRDQIAAQGLSVSVIYGALPPEVRRREAERFAQGDSHVLVATDAIGMGLNLPIRRVIFSTLTKFDGQADRPLNESEVHQIAGRAGRFGIHEEGFVGVLRDAEPTAAKALRDLLPKSPRAPRNFKAPVAPNWWHIDTIASQLGLTRLHAVLGVFMDQLQLDDAHFAVAELEQMLELAEQLDRCAPTLSLRERFVYAQAPVDSRTEAQVQEFLAWTQSHARTGQAGSPWFLRDVDEHSRLDRMEQALRSCTLWLWLDLRFPGIYGQVDEVADLRSRLNDGIERQLQGKKPLWQARGGRRPDDRGRRPDDRSGRPDDRSGRPGDRSGGKRR